MLCFRKYPKAKNSSDKEREVSRVSVGNLFSYSTENFVVDHFCAVFENFSGSEYFYG